MQLLLETRSLSWAESVRLTLLAEGIDAVILDEAAPATLGLAGSIRVAVPDYTDMERAREIVASLQPPRSPPLASWWWHKRALVAFVAGMVLSRCAATASDMPSMRMAEGLLIAATAACMIGAIVLAVLGYRADRRSSDTRTN